MMACFRGNWEEFYGEVLLLDERKLTLTAEQGIKKSSKASSVLQLVFSHLNLIEVDFFGLRFCDSKQQTHWLDPLKTLSQHRLLIGPPYIFYFGVRFYAEEPIKLKEEKTRFQFYLQLRQDVRRGRLLCPAHLRPHLSALILQAERGDHREGDMSDSEEKQEIQLIYKTLSGVSRPQAQHLVLSLCSSLEMYGVFLFAAYGENHTEYFLGPTPVGVVIYKNKVLVGKYFWQRITKLHFRDETFELRVYNKNGSETSFLFQTSDRCDCKRLWKCCVEHHTFFRMTKGSNLLTHNLKHSAARSSSLTLPWLKVSKRKAVNNDKAAMETTETRETTDVCVNQTASVTAEPVSKQTAPPAVQRSVGSAKLDSVTTSAPWENNGFVSGLFNPKFPPNTKEEERLEGPQRRTRSLDGDRPIRRSLDGDRPIRRSLDGARPIRWQRRRSCSRGNTSSGSESEKTASQSERRHRRTKKRGRRSDQNLDSTSHRRARSAKAAHVDGSYKRPKGSAANMLVPDTTTRPQRLSPDVLMWTHIQKQLVEPEGLIDRQTEEIPYKEVRVSSEPVRTHCSPRGRHQRWVSASEIHSKMVPPLPVTMTIGISCRLPTSP